MRSFDVINFSIGNSSTWMHLFDLSLLDWGWLFHVGISRKLLLISDLMFLKKLLPDYLWLPLKQYALQCNLPFNLCGEHVFSFSNWHFASDHEALWMQKSFSSQYRKMKLRKFICVCEREFFFCLPLKSYCNWCFFSLLYDPVLLMSVISSWRKAVRFFFVLHKVWNSCTIWNAQRSNVDTSWIFRLNEKSDPFCH